MYLRGGGGEHDSLPTPSERFHVVFVARPAPSAAKGSGITWGAVEGTRGCSSSERRGQRNASDRRISAAE